MPKFLRKSLSELADQIIGARTYSVDRNFPPELAPYEDSWDDLLENLEYLKEKLGADRYVQLVDMARQAKHHFDAGHVAGGINWEIKLGARLMQDMERLVGGKQPVAYPTELYRWGLTAAKPTQH
jgi:hypothetical protein